MLTTRRPMHARMSSLQTGMPMYVRRLMTMTTMPTTVISMTLSAKSSALHSGSHLRSTLISLLAPSTPTSTSLALASSPPPPPPTSPPLCSFFCCCWGALLGCRIFQYHNHLFSPIGGCLVINFSLSHVCASMHPDGKR